MLVDHTIPSAADRQREDRHDRRAGPECERGDGRGRRRRPLEEIHIDRVAGQNVLVDEHGDAQSPLEHPHHSPNCALPVDDGVTGALANLLEERVEIGVVERSGEHADRLDPQGVDDGVQLPEAEVAGEEEHALSVRVR